MSVVTYVVPRIAFGGLLPLLVLVGASLLVLLADAFLPARRSWLAPVTALALLAALALSLGRLGPPYEDPFPGLYSGDGFAVFFDVLFALAGLACLGLSRQWLPALRTGEFLALLLLAVVGMMALGHAASLVTVFLALELLSVVLYVLTGFLVTRERALESALKYFFLGAFSSAFLLYGMALVYGTTGSFELAPIGRYLAALGESGQAPPPLLLAGMAFLLVGFGFKISSVPFHMWTPDVYEGAPTPVAAFMSVGTKAAAFAALVRVFTGGLGPVASSWRPVVVGLAVLTMFVGNLIGLTQTNLKRLLAFSSIAHAGYALVGLVAWERGGREAILFYLLVYAFMNLGAFGVVASLERRGEGLHVADLAGLARTRPGTAALLAVFLLSLAGVPPTAGFMGKLYLFLAAVDAGWVTLAVLAMLCSVLAAYYYLRVIVAMYMQPQPQRAPGSEPRLNPLGFTSGIVVLGALAGVVILGIAPAPLLGVLERFLPLD